MRLVAGVEDVIAAIEDSLQPPTRPRIPPAAPRPQAAGPTPTVTRPTTVDTLTLHRAILERLGAAPVAEDQLVRDLGLPAAVVAPALLFLELDGRVQRQPGGMLSRA